MEQTKEKKYIVGSILCGLLTAFGIAATVISLISRGKSIVGLVDCIQLVLLFLVLFYTFVGYKKPHGNLLKYIILIRLIPIIIGIQALVQTAAKLSIILSVIEVGLSCYIAGRLSKAKENLILIGVETACLIFGIVINSFSGNVSIGVVSPLITWLDICVAYFLRYKQHREAGLEDAPKK